MSDALICGFADLGRVVAAVCWQREGDSGGALMLNGTAATAEVDFDFSEEYGSWRVRARTEHGSATAVVGTAGGVLFTNPGPLEEMGAGRADVEFRPGGEGRRLACPAQLSRWSGEPLGESDLLRHVALPLGPDEQLVSLAERPAGACEHDEEAALAWRIPSGEGKPGDGSPDFSEALLSTQYNGQGRPTRIGLELWPRGEDEPGPTRAAGVTIGGAHTERTSAALLDTSCEGRKGIGSYVIWRR